MLTVDNVTIFSLGLNFARCTVTCPLLYSISPCTFYERVLMSYIMVFCLQKSFHNPSLEERTLLYWDLAHFLTLRELLPHHDSDREREMAKLVLDAFEEHVFPKMSNFKKGIIYGDANGLNIIIRMDSVGDYQMVGMIDFGDCTSSYSVFDLGILLAYVMTENLDLKNGMSPIEFVGPLLGGFVDALPLSNEEIGCLYYITMARCCQSGLNGAHCFKQEPWNSYLLVTPAKCWRVIELMLIVSKEEVDKIWANALTSQKSILHNPL